MNATDDDHRLAALLAQQAGQELLRIRRELAGQVGLGDEGDRQANDVLLAGLDAERPDDAVLSEESADDLARVERRRVWIIDPLDGTREFAEEGRTDWAVHVALAIDGVAVVGAVALPAQGLVLSTAEPLPTRGDPSDPPRLVVSRTRPPAITDPLQQALGAELVPMGSAGAKVCAVVLGLADVYAHGGGQYEWDSAAPIAVAAAAGLHCSRLDGSPLEYNRPNPLLPDLLVCHPTVAEASLAVTAAG